MNVNKQGRDWIVVGAAEDSWISKSFFSTKMRAQQAMEFFLEGGLESDCSKEIRPKRKMNAYKVREKMEKALAEIQELNPTPAEIEEYGSGGGYGVVTYTNSTRYYPPKIHDAWGTKFGGRVHIDIGNNGCHLMLDKNTVSGFIEFVREKRVKILKENQNPR